MLPLLYKFSRHVAKYADCHVGDFRDGIFYSQCSPTRGQSQPFHPCIASSWTSDMVRLHTEQGPFQNDIRLCEFLESNGRDPFLDHYLYPCHGIHWPRTFFGIQSCEITLAHCFHVPRLYQGRVWPTCAVLPHGLVFPSPSTPACALQVWLKRSPLTFLPVLCCWFLTSESCSPKDFSSTKVMKVVYS